MAEPVAAERLYYESAALRFDATVTDIRLDSRSIDGQLWQVALDRTAFYPESGGQPSDTGQLTAVARSGAVLTVPVERVEEDEAGELWHYVRKPLVQGTAVTGHVDAARRLDHTQQHSGQHLLSAVFLRDCGVPTVGFHLGAERVTIDLATEPLSEEAVRAVELAASRLVAEDRAVRSLWVSREAAEGMLARGELRKLPDRAGPLRLVEIEGVEHNACGGTHVAATGAIGAILLRRTEKIKRGQRVEFCCGLRAVTAARRDFELLGRTAALLSVGAPDLPARVEKLLADAKAAAKEVKRLEREQSAASRETGRFPTGADDKLAG